MPQARGRARELAILGVVRELLAELGYERLTIDAVVARARASKTTIYNRWPDKPALVAAALSARAMDQPRIAVDARDLREDLLHFVAVCVQLAETESLTAFVSVLIAAEEEPALAEAVRGTALAPRRQDCQDIVRRAIERGEIADPNAAAQIFDLVMGEILVRYILEHRPLRAGEQDAFIDDVLLPVLLSSVPARTASRWPAARLP